MLTCVGVGGGSVCACSLAPPASLLRGRWARDRLGLRTQADASIENTATAATGPTECGVLDHHPAVEALVRLEWTAGSHAVAGAILNQSRLLSASMAARLICRCAGPRLVCLDALMELRRVNPGLPGASWQYPARCVEGCAAEALWRACTGCHGAGTPARRTLWDSGYYASPWRWDYRDDLVMWKTTTERRQLRALQPSATGSGRCRFISTTAADG